MMNDFPPIGHNGFPLDAYSHNKREFHDDTDGPSLHDHAKFVNRIPKKGESMTTKCPKCNSVNLLSELACWNCGKLIEHNRIPDTNRAEQAESKQSAEEWSNEIIQGAAEIAKGLNFISNRELLIKYEDWYERQDKGWLTSLTTTQVVDAFMKERES